MGRRRVERNVDNMVGWDLTMRGVRARYNAQKTNELAISREKRHVRIPRIGTRSNAPCQKWTAQAKIHSRKFYGRQEAQRKKSIESPKLDDSASL
jgi:hypothetical protein